MDFAATTITAIYKERWQIELFFKAMSTAHSPSLQAERRVKRNCLFAALKTEVFRGQLNRVVGLI